jgi:DNA-directed RNA polymerase specialized sigma24 family protein
MRARIDFQGADPALWLWGIARNVLDDAYRRGRAERRALRRLGARRIELSEDESRRIEELAGDDLDVPSRSLVLDAVTSGTAQPRRRTRPIMAAIASWLRAK